MKNKNDYGVGWDFGWKNWAKDMIGMAIFFVIIGIIALAVWLSKDNWRVAEAMRRHKDAIKVETLAKIPKGAFVHRIVDEELNKVCYVNCAGGGIECFDLDEVTADDEKLREDLTKYYNGYSPWKHKQPKYSKSYYNLNNK